MRAITVIALLCAVSAHLVALEIGQTAPSLAQVNWMKGEATEPGKVVTVVEFWATWCAPCRTSIPHLSKLQKKYGEKIAIVGISKEDAAKVKPFIANMGEEMDYRVGLADEATYASYMNGVSGIPHAFVVDTSGIVVWAGHPSSIDATLAQVVAGTFDAQKAATLSKAEGELKNLLKGRQPDVKNAMAKINEIFAIDPVNPQAISVRMAIGKFQKNPQIIRETLINLPLKDVPADLANSLAFERATEEDFQYRHIDVALTLIDHALRLEPENANIIDTKARLLYCTGLIDQAIDLQQQAVIKAPNQADLKVTLAYYEQIKKLASSMGTSGPTSKPAQPPIP